MAAGRATGNREAPPVTVARALRQTHRLLAENGLRSPREDAEAILCWALGRDRVFLHAHPEAALTPAQVESVRDWARRRAEHYPLQYMRGEQEFFGRLFAIDRSTLIPRPETEVVVETALRELTGTCSPRVVDVGAGSGCIAITLACELPDLTAVCVDVSPAALAVARTNAQRLGCANRVRFLESDVLTAVRRTPTFDLVVSNPPYVAWEDRGQIDPAVARHEPPEAVFADAGGLEIYRRLFVESREVLKPGGRLVVELGYDLRDAVSSLGGSLGWRPTSTVGDLAGVPRCAVFRRGSGRG